VREEVSNMIDSMNRDRFGASCCAGLADIAFWPLAEFGGGGEMGMRQRVTLLVRPDVQPTFTAAPHTYLEIVRPSAALHERSP
jgi:hypothetical protein